MLRLPQSSLNLKKRHVSVRYSLFYLLTFFWLVIGAVILYLLNNNKKNYPKVDLPRYASSGLLPQGPERLRSG